MRVTLFRDRCFHQLAACEECFADFLRNGQVPTRGCISQVVDDGAPEWVVKIISGDQIGTLVVTARNRDRIIYEGWTKFVRLAPTLNSEAPPRANAFSTQNDKSRPGNE